MKIGDIITCILGFKWILLDIQEEGKLLYVAKLYNTNNLAYLSNLDIIEVYPKPENVKWLFMKRRQKNLYELKDYL